MYIMTILQKHLVFVPICFALFALICGGLTMLLWNWLMPGIFALPEITFWQAVGLLVGYNGARNTGADARVVALVHKLMRSSRLCTTNCR